MKTSVTALSISTRFDSPLLHMLARQAAKRCDGGQGDFDALSAAILAYSAFEGFLNEVSQLAQTMARPKIGDEASLDPLEPPDPQLETLALALRIADDQRASVEYRHDLAWEVLSGGRVDRGSGARQSLGVLTRLRNALVHVRAGETLMYLDPDPDGVPAGFDGTWLGTVEERHEHPSFIRVLRSMKLLADGDERQPWIHLVCTKRVADWACDTVEQLAANLIAHAAQGSTFRTRLQSQSLSGWIERSS